ncbi:MAG: O-antigen ligase family protein [Nitrospinae bacterium]|nr:O-antigen ligase family protein [Nitrospinota bacterium]MBF0635261.1 O-antigen ligase family protein [Nitrospinota bacterium]
MSAKRNKKQQIPKAPQKHSADVSESSSERGTGPISLNPAPGEQDDDSSVRSWRNAAGWGLAVVAFLVPTFVTFNFDTVAFGNVIMGKEYILRYAALIWLIFISVSFTWGYRMTPARRAYPLIALGAVYLAWIPIAQYPSYVVPKTVVMVTCAVLFFAMASLDQRGKIRLAGATVLGGFLSLIITSAMSLTPSSILNLSLESRFSLTDTFGNQNFYAIFLLAMIPMAVFFVRSFMERGQRALAWASGFFLAVALIQFVFTYSRGAYVGAVVAAIAWLAPFSLRKTLKAGAAFLIIAAIAIGSIFALKEQYPYFYSKLVYTPRAIAQRMEIWNVGVNVFLENPVFGSGPGSLQFKALGKISEDLLKRTHGNKFVDAHNDIITVALETGAGVIFYLLFMGTALYDGYRRKDALGKLAFAGFAGIFATTLFTSATVQASTLIFPLLLGAIIAGKDDYLIVTRGKPVRPIGAFGYAGAAICLFLCWWTYRDMKETVQYATFEKTATIAGVPTSELKSQLKAIEENYPKKPFRYKYEAWISLKETDLPRYLEMSKALYENDPADLTASFNYGYALLLNSRPIEAEPLLLDSWNRVKESNNLLPALLHVVYNELGNEKQAGVYYNLAHSSPVFVKPEVVLAKLRQMKIIKR